MQKNETYESPVCYVMTVQSEGVLCVSDPLLLPGVNWGTPTDW